MPEITKNQLSLAGEFLVLSQLSLRGYVATLTLGHTKGVDILLANPATGKLFKVEVKTARRGPFNSRHFGQGLEWHMSEKHEKIKDRSLFYCFVYLDDRGLRAARFFVVPSVKVARLVSEYDKRYRAIPRKRPAKKTPMRMFRIAIDSHSYGLLASDYEDKWDYFDK